MINVSNKQDMDEYLVLVDDTDKAWGKMEKLEVHQLGLLHRAFSVFIFNTKGELLIQQRAKGKYHSSELWTNTCCSHPRYGEDTDFAADRRLKEEMGIACNLSYGFSFMYKVSFQNGLTENEFDHVYFGVSDEIAKPNASEVQNWKYINMDSLILDLEQNPHMYTEWLKICMDKVINHLQQGRNAIVA